MTKTLAIIAALAFAASTASAAPMLDAKGKCRDNGKFVAASMCKTVTTTTTTTSTKTASAKHCVKGKACGNTCISVGNYIVHSLSSRFAFLSAFLIWSRILVAATPLSFGR